MAKWLIIVGIIFTIIGFLLHYLPWTLNWFGKLPGDIHIKQENSNLYIPITSMVIVSILITVILNFLKR